MKVFVVGSATGYANFLEGRTLVDSVEEADVVLFTGGEDVDPSLYGCRKSDRTYSNIDRDLKEAEVFKTIKPNQLALGICRGSQFLCVMNGGLLVQHCTNHAIGVTHAICNDKMTYEITSTHHQMQYPYNLDDKEYEVLYRSFGVCSDMYVGDKIDAKHIVNNGEPEIVLYHKDGLPRCLAVQGHPEMIPNSPVAKMISDLVTKLIEEK